MIVFRRTWAKSGLLLILLGLLPGCSTNTYNYIGQRVSSTPYDSRYQRVEDYLRRQGLLDSGPGKGISKEKDKGSPGAPRPGPDLPPAPTLGK